MSKNRKSPYCTPKEAAEYLRLEVRTLNSMRWRNAGPRYRKHGNRVFYRYADLDAWSGGNDCGSGGRVKAHHV